MGTVGPWPVAGSHGLSAERKGTAARPCGAGGLLRPTVAVRTDNGCGGLMTGRLRSADV